MGRVDRGSWGVVLLALLACSGGPDESSGGSLTPCSSGAIVALLAPDQLTVSSGGQFFQLAGVAFGEFDEVRVLRGETLVGVADQLPYFELPPTPLDAGVNRFVLQASLAGGGTLEDRVTVVYTPEGAVPPATVTPDFVEVGVETALFFRLDVGRLPLFEPTVELWQASADGLPQVYAAPMFDNGDLAGRGDELAGDLVFSVRLDVTPEVAGTTSYVVVVGGEAAGEPVQRISTRIDVRAVAPLTAAECTAHQAVLGDLRTTFDRKRLELGFDEARAVVAADALAQGLVAEAGADACSDGLWVRFADGVLGVVPLAAWREAGATPERAAVPLTTWSTDRTLERRTATLVGENAALSAALAPDACPTLLVTTTRLDGRSLPYDWQADVGAGVFYLRGEGDLAFGGLDPAVAGGYGLPAGTASPVILQEHDEFCRDLGGTDEECSFNPQNPSGSRRCTSYGKQCVLQREREDGIIWGVCLDRRVRDLRLGRLVLAPTGYGLTPSFLRENLVPVESGVVLLDVPRADRDARLAAEFLKKGYDLVAARSDRGGDDPFPALAADLLGLEPWTAAEHAGLSLFGTLRVGVPPYRLSNGTFEADGLAGWRASGAVRRVVEFAGQTPVEGKGMALLSTGLGFSEQGGAIEQVFCPEPGTRTLRFYWRFYSEEFVEECGYQEYQDEIVASLFVGGEETRVLDATVNHLCPPDQDVGVCGVCQDPNPFNCPCGGLYQDDLLQVEGLHFDQPDGDVWGTSWREVSVQVPFAGLRPVHLRLEVRDRGDSHLDSAVLLDRIEMQ